MSGTTRGSAPMVCIDPEPPQNVPPVALALADDNSHSRALERLLAQIRAITEHVLKGVPRP